MLLSNISRFAFGILCTKVWSRGGDGVGVMDEGGFDLTAEEKRLDYNLLSTMSKNSTVQSLDQVENQA